MTQSNCRQQSDPTNTSPKDSSDKAEDHVHVLEDSFANAAIQLQADLESAKAESTKWHDLFLRKAAELENYRKRTERERPELIRRAKSSVLLEILPIMDACERAMESFDGADNPHEGLEQYREGVQLLYKQLGNALSRLGVERIEAEGRRFDPHLHEALTRVETMEHDENAVVQELRRGYMFQKHLLRPAQVVVAVRPQVKETSDS